MNRTLAVGLIGFQHGHQRDYGGALIRHPATHLQAMAAEPGASELSLEAGKAWAEEAGVPFYEDWMQMLETHRIDAMSVAVPVEGNPILVGDLAQRGIHVLCEKPIAESLAAFEEMAEKIKAAGTVFSFAAAASVFSSTFRPALARIQAGEIGEPRVINFRFLQGNGPHYILSEKLCQTARMAEFQNFGPYGVLAFEKVFQKPFQTVFARFSSTLYPRYEEYNLEDLAVLSLTMEGGGIGTITVGRTTTPSNGADFRMQVIGSEGVLTVENGAGHTLRLNSANQSSRIVYGVSATALQIDDFVGSCLERRMPQIPLESARGCVLVQEAAYLSSKSGQVVRVDQL